MGKAVGYLMLIVPIVLFTVLWMMFDFNSWNDWGWIVMAMFGFLLALVLPVNRNED